MRYAYYKLKTRRRAGQMYEWRSIMSSDYGNNYIVLTDQDGNEHLLRIGKDHNIRSGVSYRLYFKTSDSIPSGQNPLLTKAALTDKLLGVEEIK